VFEQIGGAYPGDGFGNVLFENPGTENRWIKVRLVGVDSNRFGIGARLRVVVAGEAGGRTLHREVTTGASFGCGPMTQHLGLGAPEDVERIERLEVFWPRTGATQVFASVPLERTLVVTEGEDELVVLERSAFRLGR